MNLLKSIGISTSRLIGFALFTAILLGATYNYTKPYIAEQIQLAERRVFDEVLPTDLYDNDVLTATVDRPSWLVEATQNQEPIYLATKAGALSAIVLKTDALDGYSGRISLILALSPELEVLGTRVIAHQETPGLGDKIETRKSDWILAFDGEMYRSDEATRWDVRKYDGHFDQFTGATITPRAVTRQIARTLNAIEQHSNWVEELAHVSQ